MPFEFQVLDVTYDEEFGETVLVGYLMKGAIEEPESVIVPTHSGLSYRFWMSSMQVEGSHISPLLPEHRSRITLGLSGHPPNKDVLVPCVIIADGKEK